jgi:hypothetical protein
METKRPLRYVHLSPTVLYRVPACFGDKDKPDMLSDTCIHCIVRQQCADRKEVLLR